MTCQIQNLKFKFQSICSLTTKATDESKQFQYRNTVFGNKTKPHFVGLLYAKLFKVLMKWS